MKFNYSKNIYIYVLNLESRKFHANLKYKAVGLLSTMTFQLTDAYFLCLPWIVRTANGMSMCP